MKSSLEHISLNVSDPTKSFPFYKALFTYLEYQIIVDTNDCLAVRNEGSDFWITPTDEKYVPHGFHRKDTGLNHLAFSVPSKEDVNRFRDEFLKPHNIPTLYGSPKLFPEYTPDYYAVYFEDPDRMKIEVNHFKRD